MTAIDILRPTALRNARLYDVACVGLGSLVMALSAQVAIRLPFSPVPITGQTFAVLLVAAALGARRGTLAVLVYLVEGSAGLPVFAGGGLGLARLAGPTGGYLAGLILAALITGKLAERGWDRRLDTMLLAMALGNLGVYALGLAWLATFVGAGQVLTAGLLPFLPGDCVKIVLASVVLPAARMLLGR